MKHLDVSRPAEYLRADIAQGLLAEGDAVDREGGDHGQGMLRRVSVITRGEALGHYMWIDRVMLTEVAGAINAAPEGIKGRFTHPGLSSDGLGSYLGRYKNAAVVGDRVVADLHFAQSAHETPDGDLASYVMQLAEDDPQAFGTSIVFEDDPKSRKEFEAQHLDEEGNFQTPDKKNTKNYRHARLRSLRAVDAVDSPAANPDGLFHRRQELAADAEDMLCFAFGLTDQPPQLRQLSVDPSRIERFVRSFMERHKIEPPKSQREGDMPKGNSSDNKDLAAADVETQTEPVEVAAGEGTGGASGTPAELAAGTGTPAADDPRAEAKRFAEAFGAENGVAWFSAGKTFAEALELHVVAQREQIAALQAENAKLKELQASIKTGEEEPVSFSGDKSAGETNAEQNRFAQICGDNVGAFAASLSGRLQAPSKN